MSGVSQVPQTPTLRPEVTIQAIRRHYRAVQAQLPRLQKITVNTNDDSTDGGEITAYFQGKQLVFATQQVYGETGQQRTDYLFSQQWVAFIFQRQQQYNAPYYSAAFDARKTRIHEARYYFQAGQLIRWFDTDKQPVPPTTPAYSSRQQELLLEAQQLQRLVPPSRSQQR